MCESLVGPNFYFETARQSIASACGTNKFAINSKVVEACQTIRLLASTDLLNVKQVNLASLLVRQAGCLHLNKTGKL